MLFYKQRKEVADILRFYYRNWQRSKDSKVSKKGFWDEAQESAYYFDQPLASELASIFKGSSVADFGCGAGAYVNYFISQQIEAFGCDGNPHTEELSGGSCKVIDLTEDFDLNKKFDWVLSLEVGEHIPRKYQKTYLNNLDKHADKGIILSWAVPRQLGIGHVNLRTNEYVKNIFSKLGYKNNQALEDKLRKISTLEWFENTIMVFERISS